MHRPKNILNVPTNILPIRVETNVELTRETTLSTLYIYDDPRFYLEYPETSTEGTGYLMRRDPDNWINPLGEITYSNGKPSGQTTRNKAKTCALLRDPTDPEKEILCIRKHTSCHGAKCCPHVDIAQVSEPHTKASRALIKERLQADLEQQYESASPSRDIFAKTAAFIAGIRKLGCGSQENDSRPDLLPSEQQNKEFWDDHHKILRRGYEPATRTCSGRVSLDFDHRGQALIRSENRLHLCRFLDESYDLDYIEAYFEEDEEELERIENAAHTLGYGPLVPCRTVTNVSSQRLYCPHDHRDDEWHLVQPQLVQLPCDVKFVTYQPIEEFRTACPYILVISSGVHTHPIPLPEKTPTRVRQEVFNLLESLDGDLPDLTPRRFLRHPTVKSYPRRRFPDILNPTLIELHASLANRSHLKAYITAAKTDLFPSGTGWKGLLELKNITIRKIIDIPDFPTDEFDAESPLSASGTIQSSLKIIICMSPTGSERLFNAQYIQSDIAFRRIEQFLEFELAAMDRLANTSVIFLRVYVNRQTATAHQIIFNEVASIVEKDTGCTIQWRHLHAESATETPSGMILQWTGDQHGGQAKGIGLHLQQLAQAMPAKYDLHESERLLAGLDPYDHLRRVFRLCTVHAKRNIKSCAVDEPVRHLMRSLICMRHPSWDETIVEIQIQGGKAGNNWVQDKIRSKFAFPALCWEKSFIPQDVWKAGDGHSNLIESVHADVNREGVRCTLVGGLKKGQAFDNMKMKTLEVFEDFHIRPSYQAGHLSENAMKSLKRKSRSILPIHCRRF
ncbi:hypothetical protein B0H14DRAFT_2541606 [Mycena olivaceomarginata]|nr:hypothetical protein B0H14DRAFT_2541606 [Mycena olivaceomarginata]